MTLSEITKTLRWSEGGRVMIPREPIDRDENPIAGACVGILFTLVMIAIAFVVL